MTNSTAEAHTEESSEDSNPTGSFPKTVDLDFIINRLKQLLKDPVGTWGAIKDEKVALPELIAFYVAPLAVVPVLSEYLRMVIFGRTIPVINVTTQWSIFGGLVTSVVTYATMLLGIVVAGFVIHKLADFFGGAAEFIDGVKLVAFALTPTYLGGVFRLIPGLGLLEVLCSLYGIYLFYKGIPIITKVESKKILYVIASVIVTGIIMAVIGFITAVITPNGYSSAPEVTVNSNTVDLPGGVSVDVEKFQKTMEEFQKFVPPPQ